MTRDDLERAEQLVELHLSLHRPIDLTWWEWTGLMQTRMAALSGFFGERPSTELAILFAADALALLAAVVEAEAGDLASEAA